MKDDEAARRRRAGAIRARISRLVGKPTAPPADGERPPEGPPPETPREFIHRRMRELADAERDRRTPTPDRPPDVETDDEP